MIYRLLAMFLAGFLIWLLTFARSITFRERRLGWLCGVIFLDEMCGISIGIWLARYGTMWEALCCAAGGTLAAVFIIKVLNRKKNEDSKKPTVR